MPMSQRYLIESLSLERSPPIGDLHLEFIDGVNFVVGESHFDDITIAEALRLLKWPDGGNVRIRDSGNHDVLKTHWTNCLITNCLMDGSCIPEIGPLSPSCRSAEHWTTLCFENPVMLQRISELLSESITHKLGVESTKFADVPNCGPGAFVVEVGSRGEVNVRAGAALLDARHELPPWYQNVGDLFVAMGERFLIHLSGVVAAREHLELDCPLILDGAFMCLDRSHRCATVDRLHSLGQQVIVFEDQHAFRGIKEYCRLEDNIVHLTQTGVGQ